MTPPPAPNLSMANLNGLAKELAQRGKNLGIEQPVQPQALPLPASEHKIDVKG